jgi:hypothetical protein
LSQSDINASDALSRSQTELRKYWKRKLEGKIRKPKGKFQPTDGFHQNMAWNHEDLVDIPAHAVHSIMH